MWLIPFFTNHVTHVIQISIMLHVMFQIMLHTIVTSDPIMLVKMCWFFSDFLQPTEWSESCELRILTFHVSWRPVLYTYIITINFLIIVNPINNTTQLFTGLFTIQICFQLRKDVFFGVFLWFAWKGFWDRIFFVLVWDIIFYYQESDIFLCDFVFPASCVFCVKCEGIIINNLCWYISYVSVEWKDQLSLR